MKYLFYDFETTGFSRENDVVIEIAAAVYDINKREIVETFQTFINPGRAIPAKITELTTITDEDVKHAPTEERAFIDFAKFINTHQPDALCGHNIISFDNQFFQVRINRFNLDLVLDMAMIDTLNEVKEVAKLGVLKGYDYTTPTGRVSYKLEFLMDYFGLSAQTHRAIDDVLGNVTVYAKLMDLKENNSSLGF